MRKYNNCFKIFFKVIIITAYLICIFHNEEALVIMNLSHLTRPLAVYLKMRQTTAIRVAFDVSFGQNMCLEESLQPTDAVCTG